MEINWYAVYTKSRWEKKVADQLTRLNIENYCPLNRVVKQWSDRKKIVEEPLFNSYVFVRILPNQINQIRKVLGLVNIVYWLNKPAIIPDKEIHLIQDFLSKHMNVQLEQLTIEISDRVRILHGPFNEMEGNILSVKGDIVRVLIPSLKFYMTAEIDLAHVAKVVLPKNTIEPSAR